MTNQKNNCNIDLSAYLAFGDSITAGYADGALYPEAQLQAYPNILAAQFQQSTNYKQALMPANSVGVNQDGQSRLTLRKDLGSKNYELIYLAENGDQQALLHNFYKTDGPYSNMGVPGAKVITATLGGFGNPNAGAGNYNPFFTRMTSDTQHASMLSDALLLKPTFFSLFIGNNDALAYALSGGTDNAITSASSFEKNLRTIVDALTETGAKGVIANLPSLSHIPYFTCIACDNLVLNEVNVNVFNSQYQAIGINFTEGKNNFVMADPRATNGLRQMKTGEFVLLDLLLDADKETYLNGLHPIPEKYTLSHARIAEVENAIAAYNKTIETVAQEKQLAFVDIHALLNTAKADRVYNCLTHNLDYARKGVFSLDGLHPNAFGQALMANAFLHAINEKYGCEFDFVQCARVKGIEFPEAD